MPVSFFFLWPYTQIQLIFTFVSSTNINIQHINLDSTLTTIPAEVPKTDHGPIIFPLMGVTFGNSSSLRMIAKNAFGTLILIRLSIWEGSTERDVGLGQRIMCCPLRGVGWMLLYMGLDRMVSVGLFPLFFIIFRVL